MKDYGRAGRQGLPQSFIRVQCNGWASERAVLVHEERPYTQAGAGGRGHGGAGAAATFLKAVSARSSRG